MDRLEYIRNIVDTKIESIQLHEIRRLSYIHTYGVSQNCALLASKRKASVELCCICGMLHDIAIYTENCSHKDHAHRSAVLAKKIAEDSSLFLEDEIVVITHAISEHSNKMRRDDGPITEILKDADTLQHYLYNTNIALSSQDEYRLFYILEELHIQ